MNSPRVIPSGERQERAQYAYAVSTNTCRQAVHSPYEFTFCTRVLLCYYSATEDWNIAPEMIVRLQATRCYKLGRIPQPCPVSVRNCISWCLGTPAAQFEQGVPRGCVALGKLDALSTDAASSGAALLRCLCPSDRVDAGWSATLEMLTWVFGTFQL